jgi:hypothetical protein
MTTFPYKQNSKGDFFPVIDLYIAYTKDFERTYALIDSCATISIFTQDIAQKLNLPINKGEEIYLGGVGGRIKGYMHKMKVKLANQNLIIPVVFSYEYFVSFNLLGRESVFKNFKIIFEEKDYLVKLI